MPRQNRAKIVATLGPASSTKEMIRALHEAGADVFRLNMSHGSHEDVAARRTDIADRRRLGLPGDDEPDIGR